MATEFAAGCLLFRAYGNGLGRLSGAYEAAVVGCLAVTYLNPRLNGFALLGFALVVLLAAQKTGVVAGLLSLRHVVYLGEISYSIYLVHWPLIQVSNWVYFDRALHIVGSQFVVWATIPAAILAVSAASYRWIELPARAWGRRLAGSVPAGAVSATKA
jgi:peptidoglycan/LPS O-acetylase OafA/YrhL